MHAIVLAGGLGTRVAALTKGVIPKPMLEVAGRPFLAHHLDWLIAQGVEGLVLATHHLADVVETAFGEAYRGVPIAYSREQRPAGTGGAIRRAFERSSGLRSAVVTNGDTWFPVDLAALTAFHRQHRAAVTIALAESPDGSRFGAVEIDGEGRVRRFAEKDERGATRINGGVYLVSAEALADTPPEPFSFERDILAPRLGELAVYGLPYTVPFCDIGVPEDYRRFQQALSPCAS